MDTSNKPLILFPGLTSDSRVHYAIQQMQLCEIPPILMGMHIVICMENLSKPINELIGTFTYIMVNYCMNILNTTLDEIT